MFTSICKIIFKKSKASLHYISPYILADLLRLTMTNKHGLGIFKNMVQHVFNIQGEEMKTSKRLVYQKVSKFLPFDTPIYLNFLSDMISKNVKHLDISEPV